MVPREEQFQSFWHRAFLWGDHHRFMFAGFFDSVQTVFYQRTSWFGRFADPVLAKGSPQSHRAGLVLFSALSQETLDNFPKCGLPTMHVQSPGRFPVIQNLWVNCLYALFQPPVKCHDHREFNAPVPLEPEESYHVTGLPCGVFVASAVAVEMLMDLSPSEVPSLFNSPTALLGRVKDAQGPSSDVVKRVAELLQESAGVQREKPRLTGTNAPNEPPHQGAVRADTSSDLPPPADSSADTGKKSVPKLPASVEVIELCRRLREASPNERSQNEIAREFTGETLGNDKKAQSLLRQARRHRHLWDGAAI
jgi:hypothetical protein